MIRSPERRDAAVRPALVSGGALACGGHRPRPADPARRPQRALPPAPTEVAHAGPRPTDGAPAAARARARHAGPAGRARRRAAARGRQRGRRGGARGARRGRGPARRRRRRRRARRRRSSWDIDVDTYNSHNRVQYYLDFFQGKGRERMGIWLTRMPRYEGMIRERLQREGLPGDLVYLALIESGFSNTATSRAKAVGMWQFMKGTAKGYGLRVDSWVDERRDPYRATDAAARHLKDLDDRFGSLYLAAAAYNAGAGKVSRGAPPPARRRRRRLAQLRRHLLPALRHQAAPPRDQGLRPQAHRRGAIAKEPARYGFEIGAGGAADLRLDHRAHDDRPRRHRPAGRHHGRRHPRAQSPVPPAGDAAGRGLGGAGARGARARPPSRRTPSCRRAAGHVRRAHRGAGRDDERHRPPLSREPAGSWPRPTRGSAAERLRPAQRVIVPTGGAISTSVARRMADPVEPAASSPTGFHRVRRGETLSALAAIRRHGRASCGRWNALGAGDAIRGGSAAPGRRARAGAAAAARRAASARRSASSARLTPCSRGETLNGLAKRYGVSVQALRDANGLSAGATPCGRGSRSRIPGWSSIAGTARGTAKGACIRACPLCV